MMREILALLVILAGLWAAIEPAQLGKWLGAVYVGFLAGAGLG